MIDIVDQKNNALYYRCECGANGVFVLKHNSAGKAVIVVDVDCKGCGLAERLTILRYENESDKRSLMENMESVDLSWVPVLNEETL